jgi:hypothetical protein
MARPGPVGPDDEPRRGEETREDGADDHYGYEC